MINDYASLQSAIANELARSDLTSAIPTFIQLAEADFNRTLRTRFQQATASGTITDDLTLPDDFLQMVSFRLVQNGIQREIYPDPPAGLERLVNSQGLPGGYVVINDPTGYLDGFEYVMTYISSIPALSDTQT